MWETLNSLPLIGKIIVAVTIVSIVVFGILCYLITRLPYIPVREQLKVRATTNRLAVVIYSLAAINIFCVIGYLITLPIKG